MRVMCFGTFDNLHPGHLNYFKQSRRFGSELIIVVARDQNVLKTKGHRPHQKEISRARKIRLALKKEGWIGKVVLGSLQNQYLVLKKYRPAIICLGYDQKVDLGKLKSAIREGRLFCKIKRLKPYYPEKYKSSHFRKDVNKKHLSRGEEPLSLKQGIAN